MMNWAGKRVVILGAARQGIALTRYLLGKGAQVVLSDAKPASALDLEALPAARHSGTGASPTPGRFPRQNGSPVPRRCWGAGVPGFLGLSSCGFEFGVLDGVVCGREPPFSKAAVCHGA